MAPRPEWPAEPGFAPIALGDPPPPDAPGTWAAAADPIDVTDHTIEFPVLAPLPRRRAARAGRAALTVALVLGCAGAAVAATGVLSSDRETSAPPTVGDSSVVAAKKPHRATPSHHKRAAQHHRARRHRHKPAPHRRVAVAPRRLVAAAPRAPAPIPVRHVVSSPAPKPAPQPAPKPAATQPAAAPQPAASAPSGEPGRQPPPSP